MAKSTSTGFACSACDGAVRRKPPRHWLQADGPRPEWSHVEDGQAICAVLRRHGYEQAVPVPAGRGIS
jgi:hypothetical protein